MAPTLAPYGSWKSPISADLVSGAEIGLEQIRIDGGDIYWIERRPQEGGRKVIVRRLANGTVADVTPAGFNARNRVHEYGGGDYAVSGGTLVFANFGDQRLYLQRSGDEPKPITPAGKWRYADGRIDARRNRFICVREDHGGAGEEVNTIVEVNLAGADAGTVLAAGSDFYSSPRLSPDGSRLAWLAWNHPNMPWDGTELWVGSFNDQGVIQEQSRVAGGVSESIFQPEWSPDGTLHFVSDRSGWWNLYRWTDGCVEPLCPMAAEFGQPQWNFGASFYGFAADGRILCSYSQNGADFLALLDGQSKSLHAYELPYSSIS